MNFTCRITVTLETFGSLQRGKKDRAWASVKIYIEAMRFDICQWQKLAMNLAIFFEVDRQDNSYHS